MFVTSMAGPSRLASRQIAAPRSSGFCRCRHNSSTAHKSPSSKICAVPFRLSPDDAVDKLRHMVIRSSDRGRERTGAYVALRTLSWLKRNTTIPVPESSRLTRWLGSGTDVRLKQIKACYWPTWRYDLILEGHPGCMRGTDITHEGKGWFGISDGSLPGNSWAPLSFLSIVERLSWLTELDEPQALDDTGEAVEGLEVYDPEKHLKQLGEDMPIVPIDFTVSPFGTLQRVRDLIGVRKWEGLNVDESKWKESMFVCWPVLTPVYIGEFEYEHEGETFSVSNVMSAHRSDPDDCAAFTPLSRFQPKEETDEYAGDSAPTQHYWGDDSTDSFMSIAFLLHPAVQRSVPLSSVPISKKGEKTEWKEMSELLPPDPQTDNTALQRVVRQWLSPAPQSQDEVPPSPLLKVELEYGDKGTARSINWDDPRIRKWSPRDKIECFRYWAASSMAFKKVREAERYDELDRAGTFRIVERDDDDPDDESKMTKVSGSERSLRLRRAAARMVDGMTPGWMTALRDAQILRDREERNKKMGDFWAPKILKPQPEPAPEIPPIGSVIVARKAGKRFRQTKASSSAQAAQAPPAPPPRPKPVFSNWRVGKGGSQAPRP